MSAKAAKRVVKQLAGSGTGQSLLDRVTQAKYSLAGSGLGKAVAKASTEEIGAPKKKHLDYLISCSNEPNVSIPLLAGLLVERIQEKSWVVVFKGLITTHNLMNFGNDKFSHYLATNSCSLCLESFNDKTSPQSYEMSLSIRRYSRYVNEKRISYRAMAFDFCKVKRGREDGVLRTMPIDKLLKALPVLSSQLSILLDFDAQEKDLNNPVILAAFLLLYKDLVRLFASYNEGMINLIEHYFTLQLSQCRIGLDLYNSFPDVQTRLTEFLTLAETMGIGEKDSLGLQPVPPKVIQAMEQHLAILEKKKGKEGDEEDSAPGKPCPQRPLASTRTVSRPKPVVPVAPATVVAKATPKAFAAAPTGHTPTSAPPATTTVVTTPEASMIELEDESTAAAPPLVVLAPSSQDEDEQVEGNGVDGETVEEGIACADDGSLPSELQMEAIAAATSMFSDSLMKSNEAVRRSAEQRDIPFVSTVHTQLGRYEQRTVSVAARSRSSSPARPKPPSAVERDEAKRLQPNKAVGGGSVSDGELESQEVATTRLKAMGSIVGGSMSQYESRKPSSLALNEDQPVNGSGLLISSGPSAANEAKAEPTTSDPEWPTASGDANGEHEDFAASSDLVVPTLDPPSSTSSAKSTHKVVNPHSQPKAAPAGTSSALDDLLGLDLLGWECRDGPVMQPTRAASGDPVSSIASDAWQTNTAAAAATSATTKPTNLDADLLSFDPLLNPESSAPDASTTSKVATELTDPDQLPAGLKKVSSNMPIRPVVMQQAQKKDPLDALDSTLANLASSLGGQQKPWGAGSSNKSRVP